MRENRDMFKAAQLSGGIHTQRQRLTGPLDGLAG